MKANQPSASASAGAMKVAKIFWPRGATNVFYCWKEPGKNEREQEQYRIEQANIIDRETALPELVQALQDCIGDLESHAVMFAEPAIRAIKQGRIDKCKSALRKAGVEI